MREAPRAARKYSVWLFLAFAGTHLAMAQSNDEINSGLQFNFVTPGARSLAMGSAFVGLADDATAALANPAGLMWLTRSEFSLEGRQWNSSSRFSDGGSFSGAPSGVGIDVAGRALFTDYEADTTGPAFLSYVWAGPDRKWRLAVYRHELSNFAVDVPASEGAFYEGANVRFRTDPLSGTLDLDIAAYGVSGAYEVTETFWIGVGVAYNEFDLQSSTFRWYREAGPTGAPPENVMSGANFGATNFADPSQIKLVRNQSGTDDDISFNLGILWKSESDKFAFGAVYRKQPTFTFDNSFTFTDDAGNLPSHAALNGAAEFEVPSVLAVGFSVRPTSSTLFTFEYDRVEYSTLMPSKNVLAVPNFQDSDLADITVDDGDEFHAGFEYGFGQTTRIALRVGAWLDPDHQMHYSASCGNPRNITEAACLELQARFPEGEDEVHYTGGIGAAFGESGFELNVAGDVSDRGEIYSLSMIYRLK